MTTPHSLRTIATVAALAATTTGAAHAQTAAPDFAAPAIAHAQRMRAITAAPPTLQSAPTVVPVLGLAADPSGTAGTVNTGGPTATAANAFFQSLGTNGRSCVTCHDPQTGWTVTPAGIQARFQASAGTDPLFRLVDGATCPTASVATPTAQLRAYALLLGNGLFRVGMPLPAGAQFTVTAVNDPYDCTTQPATGLTGPASGILSVYRRPLPTTNLRFQTGVMWDGREPSLASQSVDATLIHAQAELRADSGAASADDQL